MEYFVKVIFRELNYYILGFHLEIINEYDMMLLKYIGTFVAILVVVIVIGLVLKKEKPTTPIYYNKQIKNVKVQNVPEWHEESKDQYRNGIKYTGYKEQIIDLL